MLLETNWWFVFLSRRYLVKKVFFFFSRTSHELISQENILWSEIIFCKQGFEKIHITLKTRANLTFGRLKCFWSILFFFFTRQVCILTKLAVVHKRLRPTDFQCVEKKCLCKFTESQNANNETGSWLSNRFDYEYFFPDHSLPAHVINFHSSVTSPKFSSL